MRLKFCKDCKICCSFGAALSKRDFENCGSLSLKSKIERYDGIQKFAHGKCPILVKTGCLLPYKNRPLDCRIFPMTFRLENDGIVFYLEQACPFIEKLPRGWGRKHEAGDFGRPEILVA